MYLRQLDGMEDGKEHYHRERESLSTRGSRKIKSAIKQKEPQIILYGRNISFKEGQCKKEGWRERQEGLGIKGFVYYTGSLLIRSAFRKIPFAIKCRAKRVQNRS